MNIKNYTSGVPVERTISKIEQALAEGLALFGELGLTAVENELRKAGIALLWNQQEDMRKSLAALKEVK